MQETKKTPAGLAYALVFALWLAAVLVYARAQKPVAFNGGLGWDGARYEVMYEQARDGQKFFAEKPFAYRVATPWIAGHLGFRDARKAFHAVNLASILLTGLLIMAMMRALGARTGISLFLIAVWLLQWHAPLRQQFYDSFGVDAASQPFTCLIFLAHLRLGRPGARYGALSLLAFLGVFFRESVAFAAAAVCLAELVVASRDKGWLAALRAPAARLSALPLLAAALGIAITHRLAEATGPYGFFNTVAYFLYHKPLPVLVHAFYNGYGTALIPVLVFWRRAWAHIRREPLLGIYPLITFLLGWTAGGDTTRINFWGCFALLPLMSLVLSELRLATFGIAPFLLLEIICTRMAWPFPEYPGPEAWRLPLLTNWGSAFPYFDLWSELANPRVLMISLFQYLALTAAAFLWIGKAGRSAYLRPDAGDLDAPASATTRAASPEPSGRMA